MNAERWGRVKALFEAALEQEPLMRRAWLEGECGDDTELLSEVLTLLEADEGPVPVLDKGLEGALGELLPAFSFDPTGHRFGPYRVVREIGRGGMATVFEAVRDDDQFEQRVAIKLIKRGMDTDAILERFRRERQILANLQHANIARLLDGGVSDEGLPYLVMECIEGEPIDRYCDVRELSVEERLQLFLTVCGAVEAAHRNLVVHRDLKPGNILVTPEGEPKLLDFGIAKLLDDPGAFAPTVVGVRPMTPEYASPEQLRGEPVNTVSDVYSLGVLLYEVLTGHRPHIDPPETRELRPPPKRPSTVLGRTESWLDWEGTGEVPVGQDLAERVAASRGGSAQRLRRRLAGDLDNIVLRALEEDPSRRYGSVRELAEDLRRHLVGLPVHARSGGWLYRWGKFLRRHRVAVAAASLVFISLVAGLAATLWQARVADEERKRAEWVSDFLVGLFEDSQPDKALGDDVLVRDLLDEGALRIRQSTSEPPQARARILHSIGRSYSKLWLYESARPLLQEALELYSGEAADALALASCRDDLGDVLTILDQPAEAASLHQKAFTTHKRLLGEDHPRALDSQSSLGVALFHQGLLEEAEQVLRTALEGWKERERGSEQSGDALDKGLRTSGASVRNNLALVLRHQGELDEAGKLYKEVLASNREGLGEKHPYVAVNLNNLAEVYRDQERCEEALDLYDEAMELERVLRGDKHVGLAVIQNNKAGCLKDLRRWDEAIALYTSALEIYEESVGKEHTEVAATLNNLAEVYHRWGDLEEGETLYRRALAIHRSFEGERHPNILPILGNLATLLVNRGATVEAEAFYREALAIEEALGGEQRLDFATLHHNLGSLLLRQKRYQEAADHFNEALTVRRIQLGEEHSEVGQSLYGLCVGLGLGGPPEAAEGVLQEGLAYWLRQGDNGRGRVAGIRRLLGGILVELDRYEEAESQLLTSEEAIPDPRTRKLLVELYEAWGRSEEAERFRSS